MDQRIFEDCESAVRCYCRGTPDIFVRAKGARLWNDKGREFVDFLSGCGSLNYGHNDPSISSALISYLQRDGIGNALDFHTAAKLAFIERFNEVILKPRNMAYRLQFTGPTGTNCVEAALKLARKHTGRHGIVAFTNAFHGMSSGSLSVTGSRAARRGLEQSLQGVMRLPFESYHGAGVPELERFAKMARDPSGGVDPVAAIIVETVQGEGGLNVASVRWLRAVRELANDVGAMLVVDDIQAGCGRTGEFFSFERAGIQPDLVCLSKSLGGGLPMSLLMIDPRYDSWQPGEHSGTFRGNSLSFVAATAALDFWTDRQFLSGIQERERYLDGWISRLLARFPGLKKKGLGLMAGIELPEDLATAAAVNARREGLLIETCGPHDEVLKIFPPLNIEMELLDLGLSRLETAIRTVSRSADCSVSA